MKQVRQQMHKNLILGRGSVLTHPYDLTYRKMVVEKLKRFNFVIYGIPENIYKHRIVLLIGHIKQNT